MEARRRVRLNEGHDRGVLASLAERRSGIATAPQKGKPLCVGFSFTLRDVLVIHDSESCQWCDRLPTRERMRGGRFPVFGRMF